MWREFDYLAHNGNAVVVRAQGNGWTMERIRIVAVLNAFNRIVVGPLSAAFRSPTRSGLGNRLAITYGERIEISSRTAVMYEPALAAFESLALSVGLKPHWLNIGRASDLIWVMGNSEPDRSTPNDGEVE